MDDHARRRVTRRRPRSGGESRRFTRKQSQLWQQSGGAIKEVFPFTRPTEPQINQDSTWATRKETWKGRLAKFGLSVLVADPSSYTPQKYNEDLATAYITLLAKQDELFLEATDIIYEKFGITKPVTTGKLIEKLPQLLSSDNKTDNISYSYIKDVLNWVYLGTVDISTSGPATKFKQIIFNKTQDLVPDILLYPRRLTNVFIQSLARIFYQLKDDRSLIDSIKDTNTDEDITRLLATHYHGYTKTYTYTTTSKELRDFVTPFNIANAEIEKILIFKEDYPVFFHNLIAAYSAGVNLFKSADYATSSLKTLGKKYNTADFRVSTVTELTPGSCKDFFIYGSYFPTVKQRGSEVENNWFKIIDKSYIMIAVSLLRLYIDTKNEEWTIPNILNKFKLDKPSACAPRQSVPVKSPFYAYTRSGEHDPAGSTLLSVSFFDSVIAGTENVTLKMLLSQMSPESLNFMLQLVHNIKLVEQEEAAAKAEEEAATKAEAACATAAGKSDVAAAGSASSSTEASTGVATHSPASAAAGSAPTSVATHSPASAAAGSAPTSVATHSPASAAAGSAGVATPLLAPPTKSGSGV